uniref:Securin n=1 Tax=Capra hircus TaxID=9925 RepID=A0A452F1H4_CAPHI
IATLLFIKPCTHVAPKDRLNMECVPSVKALDGRSQASTPRVNKMFDAPPALPKTARKTLETVTKSYVPASDHAYSEIEKLFPFNPLDFESINLPEEHQIAHLPLNGVPLMIHDEERELEQLLYVGPLSPLKMSPPLWESNLLQSPSSILSTLDVELPPVCYDLDI